MKPKIVFFDCDNVLIFGEPWFQLDKNLGMPISLEQQWQEDYYAGKLSFKEWNDRAEFYYLKYKLTRKFYLRELKKFTINKEAIPLIKHLKENNIRTAIISSGIKYYVRLTAKMLGIDYYKANYNFIFNKKNYFEKLKYTQADPIAKVHHIDEICKVLSIKPTDSLYIGDDVNDLEAFKYTKHGLFYRRNNKLLENVCLKKIYYLTEVIDIIKDYSLNKLT